MNNQKGLAPIVIVILITVALGGYLLYKQQPKPTSPTQVTQSSPTPFSSSSPNETANWKTYTNSDWSVRYPSEWDTLVCQSVVGFGTHLPISCATDITGIFSIHVDNIVRSPLVNMDEEAFQAISRESVSIGNEQGELVLVQKVKEVPGADRILVAAVVHKGKTYTFNMMVGDKSLFNQILSTFKFTQ
ncbi:hypothetical protein HY404_02365 [Candidatus Microgenomates bacterium]|nr:hypothetical protein [Candidatus Microgenomates bacterium]